MGNTFDKLINGGPPFAPKCSPDCTPGPDDLRGNICYKGKCVALCPIDSTLLDGKCVCNDVNVCNDDNICNDKSAVYKDFNKKNQQPSEGDGWGHCVEEEDKKIKDEEELEKKLTDPSIPEGEKEMIKKMIDYRKGEKKEKEKQKKKQKLRFNPVSLFTTENGKVKSPPELDNKVKTIVTEKLKENPKMTDDELAELISETTTNVIEQLAVECEEEYKIAKMILSPAYGYGKWPTKKELEKLIDEKNFPWSKKEIELWLEEKQITSCSDLSYIKDKIARNNDCIYSYDYPDVVEACNVNCGSGTEIRQKIIIKKSNIDFPSLQPCSNDPPKKEFDCDTGKVCKEDCELEINTESFDNAKCDKPCDSGDGPGEKTYKVKYVKASQGGGSCDLDEEEKEEGQEYDVTVECNKKKCPDCEVKSKGPFKNELVDYTGSINVNGKNKTFTKCLLPKEDGTFKDIDCGGSEGGFNYNKGARSKYNMEYNITKDGDGIQNCTEGEDVVEEGCPVYAFSPDRNPIVGTDGKKIKGGGEPCANDCILSDDFSQLVMVEGKECSKTCGRGIKIMRKFVKSKSNAVNCPCRDDPNNCPYKKVPCNTTACPKDCVYINGEDTKHVQINDKCPGREGPNKSVVWDTEKGMWHDEKNDKFYERSHFVKKMRVPTKDPPIGKGLCYQGDKADFTLPCPTEGTFKPVDAVWGPWEFEGYEGESSIGKILHTHSKWTFPKINTVEVGSTQVGDTVPGSGTVDWPSGGITKAVEVVEGMGHTLGKTVHYISNKDGKIWLYKKGKKSRSVNDTWEFQKEIEKNPNKGLFGEHCIKREFVEDDNYPPPGKIYQRKITKPAEHGGKIETCYDPEIDSETGKLSCSDRKVIPYMKNDGINTKKRGNPSKNMKEIECKKYGESIQKWKGVITDETFPKGCIQKTKDNNHIFYNNNNNEIPCSEDYECIEHGPGGAGYIRYCPEDAVRMSSVENVSYEDTGNQTKCYRLNANSDRGKYTIKELENEAKRKFVRDITKGDNTILGRGNRTIFRFKERPKISEEQDGGLPVGRWHEKENFGDVNWSSLIQ
jgi:hypothetical protein